MFCKFCGWDVPEDSVYCPKCGKNLLQEDPAKAGGPPAASVRIARNGGRTTVFSPIRLFLDGKYICDMKDMAHYESLQPGEHNAAVYVGRKEVGSTMFVVEDEGDGELLFKIKADNTVRFDFRGSVTERKAQLLQRNYSPRTDSGPSYVKSSGGSGCLWMILGVVLFVLILYWIGRGL